ncbi:MAG: LysM peptidoglycan-binding domain-containing protein, partial [Burkholderiales bacterium]|nr:LysM peptidoglycan-binding domain-containing protein [Burkholderiales bacterium]
YEYKLTYGNLSFCNINFKKILNRFLGISKVYLKEHNYPSAYYYINLYQGTSSVDLLKVKIAALAGLLASNRNLPNYATLSETLLDYQHQLLKLSNSQVAQSPKPVAIKKVSIAPAASTKAYDNKRIDKQAKASDNSAEITNESWLSLRVRVIKGRKSVVVEPQDTLYSLAKKSNTSLDSLIKINHIHNNQIKIGQTLYLQ